jgi:hypothetical protein
MRALSLLTCPDDPRLTLNIHFAVMGFFPGGQSITSHVWFLIIESISLLIASFQSSYWFASE